MDEQPTTAPVDESSEELLAIRLRKAALLRKKVELVKAYGLPFYKPFPKQQSFHTAGLKFKRRMVRSGNRFGKSTMGCAEDSAWLLRERSWLPESDPARRGGIPQHPIKLLTITTDWDKIDEIWTSQKGEGGKVWKFLPRDGFVKSVRRNHSGAIDTIECANGSLWRFDTVKSFKANPLGSESSDWDAIHVDEPIPEDMWKAVSRGLVDRGGSAWFTLTPLNEFWINDYFFPADTGGAPRDNVWAVTGSTTDNPYLPPEAIAQFEADLTPDEVQCRIHGIPLHLSGLIYKEFSWDKHVLKDLPAGWESYGEPPRDWPVYVYIDPHPQTPHAVLFCTVSPFGTRYYFNDVFKHCGIEALVKGDSTRDIEGILPFLRGRRVIWCKMDPLGFILDPEDEYCMATEACDHGLYVEKATKALAQGILRVQTELKKVDSTGRPVIRFTPLCRRTLWEIQRYCWDEKENKPIDKDDHMMENLYRAEISNMKYVDCTVKPNDKQAVKDEEITSANLDLSDLNYLGSTEV